MQRIAVFGATGSTGACALDVIGLHPDHYRVSVLTAHRDVETLAELCARHRPALAIIADPTLEQALQRRVTAAGVHCEIASGAEAMTQAAGSSFSDTVVTAIAGLPGADVMLTAARAGRRLILAHQESAVVSGPLLQQALAEGGGELIPLDAGLLAAFQCLARNSAIDQVERLSLMGSGGALAGRHRSELMTVSPEQLSNASERVTRRKAAVNSASLMDRGLQLIAAHQLFRLAPKQIEILINPERQAYAQISGPDGPAHSHTGPANQHEALTLAFSSPEISSDMETWPAFDRPDEGTFRCLALARQALQAGGDAPLILNAANEVAVEAFLAGSWPFLAIPDLIEQVLMELPPEAVVDIQTLSDRDRAAREAARRVLRNAC
jgi:1-deoxy-D-xylulose-5-phosphate reductoisomerase